MPLPSVTDVEIHSAASQFDAEMAAQPELAKWQSDNAFKYGVRIGGKLYPVKRIIEMATGVSVDTFHGGRESIEYLRKRGFEVEPLRMPGASEIEAALHEYLLEVHPQSVSAQEAYEGVANRLHLSETMKNVLRESTDRRKWDNVVRGARAKLVKAGVIVDDGERNVWRLKTRKQPRWWIEKTLVEGRPDRETGPDRLGKAMWSPHRSRSGGDIYAAMRQVQAGDRVIHLINNGPIAGISVAVGRPRLDFPALSSSEWEGMPCYRVELEDYQPLEPKIERQEFLGDPKLAEQLLTIQKSDAKVFYNSKLELNQGSYITEAPEALLELIRKVFEVKSGKTLPHFTETHSGSAMNLLRLRSGIRLFTWMFGNEGFASPRYLEEERNYKEQISSEWRSIATRQAFEEAISDQARGISLAQALARLLVGQQIRWVARPEVAELLAGLEGLPKEAREDRRQRLEKLLTSQGERRALMPFFDLTLSEDALVLLKSTYFHQGLKKSILRVYGAGRSRGGYSFDDLGHQTPVKWVSDESLSAEIPTGLYPKVSGTLDVLPIVDVLDLLSVPVVASAVSEAGAEDAFESESPDEVVLPPPMPGNPPYSLEDFLRETRIPRSQVEQWQFNLHRKKQMILQGPPGTGKTFVAERLAKLLLSSTNGVKDLVQFHPSYSYEDFIEGIRPDVGEDGGAKFRLARGRFAEFCDRAKQSQAPHVLIIDEINRANLSRVFGELMYLLEYRDAEIPLPSGATLTIPPNVFLIGTMNTADRSIALVDHALRRRFAFVYLEPDYSVLKDHLDDHELPTEGLIQTLEQLNKAIADRHYSIGVSYFLKDGALLKQRLEGIWRTEIEPYLEEYFYDRPDKAAEFSWDKLRESRLGDWSDS